VPRNAAPILVLVMTTALAAAAPGSRQASSDPFRARGVEGAFALLDTGTGKLTVQNRSLAGRRFIPCSTFKIPNTLIGLETGVIPDERFSLKWDGVERQRPEWNRDHDLSSAMKHSVVWFYQEVARRIGPERMAEQVRRLGFGNRKIAGPVDQFWLDGPLAISPLEQVDFLRRLHAGKLAVKPEHAGLVLRLIELERGPEWLLRGKTGGCRDHGRLIGWLVGSVENRGRLWIYATFIRGGKSTGPDALMPMRREIAEELLRSHGVLPPR
jgi:beta-lactamase class D